MKKVAVYSFTAIALTLSTQSMAAERSADEKVNEAIGLGSGAAAGALVGGPVGAIIGGIFGVLIADDANDTSRQKETDAALAKKTAEIEWQSAQLAQLKRQYNDALEANTVQLVAMDKEMERVMQEIKSQVLFKTASYEIEEHFKPQLDLVAKGLKTNPELRVTLSGYADARGDDSYNQSLSQKRAWSVRSYLVAQGVNEKQLQTASFGESQPVSAQASHEDHFFDRRVLLHVAKGDKSMTAAAKLEQ